MEHKTFITLFLDRLLHADIRDYFVMGGLIFVLTVLGAFIFTRGLSVHKPGVAQQILELTVGFLRNMLTDMIPHHGEKFVPWIGPFALFILFSNLVGMIPWFHAATGYWMITAALGISSFLVFTFLGIRETGIHYGAHFIGPLIPIGKWNVPVLLPLFLILEPISHLARPFSLSLRLFANIMGEHEVTSVFLHLVPLGVPIAFLGLGLFTSFLQTFIFVTLSVIYISLAVEHH